MSYQHTEELPPFRDLIQYNDTNFPVDFFNDLLQGQAQESSRAP
jgi:hypothetical protein